MEQLLFDKGITPQIQIVGNGPDSGEIPKVGIQIRFNRKPSSDAFNPLVIWINNTKGAFGRVGFISEGPNASEELDSDLLMHAQRLSKELNSWPSTGIVVASYLSQRTDRLKLYQMPLLPSLIRFPDMDCRQPLACAFHNWLGERRIVFTGKFNLQPWPSLFLQYPKGGTEVEERPFDSLCALQTMSRKHGGELLKQLGKLSAQYWLSHATFENLLQIEHLFFLERGVHQTANWWLYDVDASNQADVINRRLAWCQQQLFLNRELVAP